MSKNIDSLDVSELLEMFKDPAKTEAKGKCTFMRKVDTLSGNVQEAIKLAVANQDVTNREILAFINTHTDAKVNLTMVQDHRHKEGCVVCLYGTAR